MGSYHMGDGRETVQDRGSSVVGRAVAVGAEASGRVSGSGLPVVKASDLTVAAGALTPVLPPQSGECDGLSTTVYLKKILTSKVYDIAVKTPLEEASRLSERVGSSVLLKREDLQPVFSFKLRGAYNCMAQLSAEQKAKGVITASAGNHAQGVAMSAARLGVSAIVAMPTATPSIKVNNVRRLGAQVELVGDTFDGTAAWAREQSETQGRPYIPPFDHPDTIAGQGTIAMEIFNQTDSASIDAIFVPVGGGGLIAGIASYAKALRPEILVIGVEPAGANAMAHSLAAGERVELASVNTFADGVAVKQVGEECFRMCRQLVDGVVLVPTDATCAAIKDVFEDTRSILEPAGALAVAGAKAYLAHHNLKGKKVVCITSGANMNFSTLRTVSELADLGGETEALLAAFIPDVPGSFFRWYETLGEGVNITEFKYRMNPGVAIAQILFSVTVKNPQEVADIQMRLNAAEMRTVDLSDDDVTTTHLRFLTGGGGAKVENERLFQFVFPEKPGSLKAFLSTVAQKHNVSLFHYRNTGERQGKVLVGLQLAEEDMAWFREKAASLKPLGFDYTEQTEGPWSQLLNV